MKRLVFVLGLVACTHDYGPPTNATKIVMTTSMGGTVTIAGTKVTYQLQPAEPLTSDISKDKVAEIIHALEGAKFLGHASAPSCAAGGFLVTIEANVPAGSNKVQFADKCDPDLDALAKKISDLSGLTTWLVTRK